MLVVEAGLGAWLMRHQGARAWTALNDAYTKGQVPTGHLADAALILVGGVLLMLPGFVTDVFGFVFLLPLTRPFARKMIAFFVARRISKRASAGVDTANVIKGESVEGPNLSPRPKRARQRDDGPVVIKSEIEEPPASAENQQVGEQPARKRGRPRFGPGCRPVQPDHRGRPRNPGRRTKT